jgi:hypothetical protein
MHFSGRFPVSMAWVFSAGVLALAGICPAVAQDMAVVPASPVETTVMGLFAAVGPVRWGVLVLALCLGAIAVSCLVFLTMPLERRRDLGSSLASLKEWNTVLSTLCTVLGPVGTYIGMIGALQAMHRVAIATDAATRLAAQAEFFGQAAHMFVSSLAGIGVGLGLGLVNTLLLHHVLPEHRHPIEGQGLVAASAAILRRWIGVDEQVNAGTDDRADGSLYNNEVGREKTGAVPRLALPAASVSTGPVSGAAAGGGR